MFINEQDLQNVKIWSKHDHGPKGVIGCGNPGLEVGSLGQKLIYWLWDKFVFKQGHEVANVLAELIRFKLKGLKFKLQIETQLKHSQRHPNSYTKWHVL